MPVEFIGMIHTNDGSESRPQTTPLLDPDFTRRHAQAHEDAGFDRVLIGYGSSWPEGTQVAAHVAAHTQRLGLLIAHRPGFVFPTLAARQFATLDQFSGGRVAVHVITGGNDAEQRRDGDYLAKDERYARTDEYLQILRQSWAAAEPVSFDGRFYRFEGYHPRCGRCARRHPLFFGGSSAAASGRRQARGHVRAVGRAAEGNRGADRLGPGRGRRRGPSAPGSACRSGRSWGPPRNSPGNGRTASWRPSRTPARPRRPVPGLARRERAAGEHRLAAAAGRRGPGDLHDRALWTATARASGAGGNSTALVGTPDTVAQALLDYVDIGVSTLLIRGYDPLEDATDYGRELIPLVRAEVARRDAAAAQAGAETELAGRA